MNYFEFYELPVSFHPDERLIKDKFYALSKKFHPDFYVNEDQEKQDEVLNLSTLNNKAFQVLSDPQKRLHYVLELEGELKEGESYILPQDFLMDMMEINEAIMEQSFSPDVSAIEALKLQVAELEVVLDKDLQILTSTFDQAESGQAQLLKEIKDIYYRKKYLLRIKESFSQL
ncbi:Co-chaperone protein HscB [compost metagenome]